MYLHVRENPLGPRVSWFSHRLCGPVDNESDDYTNNVDAEDLVRFRSREQRTGECLALDWDRDSNRDCYMYESCTCSL